MDKKDKKNLKFWVRVPNEEVYKWFHQQNARDAILLLITQV